MNYADIFAMADAELLAAIQGHDGLGDIDVAWKVVDADVVEGVKFSPAVISAAWDIIESMSDAEASVSGPLATYRNSLNDSYKVYSTGKGFKVEIAQADGVQYVKRFNGAMALDNFLTKRNLKLVTSE